MLNLENKETVASVSLVGKPLIDKSSFRTRSILGIVFGTALRQADSMIGVPRQTGSPSTGFPVGCSGISCLRILEVIHVHSSSLSSTRVFRGYFPLIGSWATDPAGHPREQLCPWNAAATLARGLLCRYPRIPTMSIGCSPLAAEKASVAVADSFSG